VKKRAMPFKCGLAF